MRWWISQIVTTTLPACVFEKSSKKLHIIIGWIQNITTACGNPYKLNSNESTFKYTLWVGAFVALTGQPYPTWCHCKVHQTCMPSNIHDNALHPRQSDLLTLHSFPLTVLLHKSTKVQFFMLITGYHKVSFSQLHVDWAACMDTKVNISYFTGYIACHNWAKLTPLNINRMTAHWIYDQWTIIESYIIIIGPMTWWWQYLAAWLEYNNRNDPVSFNELQYT